MPDAGRKPNHHRSVPQETAIDGPSVESGLARPTCGCTNLGSEQPGGDEDLTDGWPSACARCGRAFSRTEPTEADAGPFGAAAKGMQDKAAEAAAIELKKASRGRGSSECRAFACRHMGACRHLPASLILTACFSIRGCRIDIGQHADLHRIRKQPSGLQLQRHPQKPKRDLCLPGSRTIAFAFRTQAARLRRKWPPRATAPPFLWPGQGPIRASGTRGSSGQAASFVSGAPSRPTIAVHRRDAEGKEHSHDNIIACQPAALDSRTVCKLWPGVA